VAEKKRTRITVETHQLLLVRSRRGTERVCCQLCGEPFEMLTVEEAALAASVSPRTIFKQIEAGTLHYLERRPGPFLVCINSLLLEESTNNT
jgi:hypothetical protein